MDVHITTTPFGRRPLSLAMVRAQEDAKNAKPDTVAHKWHVWRNLTEAKDRLNITDRSLAVLNALLSFHQETALVANADLVVFPSNRELSIRAHGIAPATLRRHLATLVEAGLIIRRDSPNGKRYARKGQGGEIEQAFGFDMSPLVNRAAEFAEIADDVRARRRACALMREQITLLRRDIAKTIEAGVEQGVEGPWSGYMDLLSKLSQGLLRVLGQGELEGRLVALRSLYDDVAKSLAVIVEIDETSGNESQSERHIQSSKPDTLVSEPVLREGRAAKVEAEQPRPKSLKVYPLGMVLEACPDVTDWISTPINNWSDFVQAAGLVRTALGISPSAWDEATDAMGEVEASVCIAAILQRTETIRSPGGYLRTLTEKARAGQFSLGPVLMALLRSKLKERRSATG
jgi:replication initiation protein RepC